MADIRGRDDVQLVTKVIERQKAIEEHKNAIRQMQIIFGGGGKVLEMANGVVGKVADGASGERRKSGNVYGSMLAQRQPAGFEKTAWLALDFRSVTDSDFVPPSADDLVGSNAEEGVASNSLATFDGFQQKRIRLTLGQGRNAETGVSRSAEIVRVTGTSVAVRANRENVLKSGWFMKRQLYVRECGFLAPPAP